MKDLFAKCGANCGHCPSYRENLRTNEDRQRCSDGWHRYHAFRLSPGKLRRCDGCQTPDDENPVRYISCNKRGCALFNHLETCARCSAYPCEAFGPDFDREEIEVRLGSPIPEEDYVASIEPYESRRHLDQIRASLDPGDIQAMTMVSLRPTIVDFPGDLPFPEEETSAFGRLHRLLASVGAADGVSYAQRLDLQKRRRHLLKMLWAFGRFGEREEEGSPHLVIDSETYLAQKIHSNYSRVMDYLGTLRECGVRCEHVPLAEEGWLTPTKALRRRGWFMRMSIDKDAGGMPVLEALRQYAARLDARGYAGSEGVLNSRGVESMEHVGEKLLLFGGKPSTYLSEWGITSDLALAERKLDIRFEEVPQAELVARYESLDEDGLMEASGLAQDLVEGASPGRKREMPPPPPQEEISKATRL